MAPPERDGPNVVERQIASVTMSASLLSSLVPVMKRADTIVSRYHTLEESRQRVVGPLTVTLDDTRRGVVDLTRSISHLVDIIVGNVTNEHARLFADEAQTLADTLEDELAELITVFATLTDEVIELETQLT